MNKKIKFVLRPNLIYPLLLIIWSLLRKIILIIISKIYNFEGSIIYTFLMFLGELVGGFIFYFYSKRYTAKKQWNIIITNVISSSISSKRAIMKKNVDSYPKISFLVFMTAFFDFFEFILTTYYVNKIHKISSTLQIRFGAVLIVISSLLCRYLLKIQILKHHIFSLIILGIGILLLIISEYLFQVYDLILTANNLTIGMIFSILSHISIAFNNTIEKYLIETNYMNHFLLLTFQGIIGLIFTIICAFYEDQIPNLKNVYNNNSSEMFTLFIFLILFYTIFGALKNIYRMYTILLFQPMTKHLADFIINPIYIIYYFSAGEDFLKDGQRDYFYFFTNLLLLIIFDIFGLIFNEFIVLFCCGLDFNTYNSISLRADICSEMIEMTRNDDSINYNSDLYK